jgi:hypothetical protein
MIEQTIEMSIISISVSRLFFGEIILKLKIKIFFSSPQRKN